MKLLFGTLPKWLSRADGPDTSHAAGDRVDTTNLEALVYDTIAAFGKDGATSDEVRAELHWLPYSSVTARFSALKRKGYIEDTGERRKGASGRSQAVLRAVP